MQKLGWHTFEFITETREFITNTKANFKYQEASIQKHDAQIGSIKLQVAFKETVGNSI